MFIDNLHDLTTDSGGLARTSWNDVTFGKHRDFRASLMYLFTTRYLIFNQE